MIGRARILLRLACRKLRSCAKMSAVAEVVELADTRCSGRRELYARVGSNPTFGTSLSGWRNW